MSCLRQVIQAVEVARSKGIPVIWVIRQHEASGGVRCACALPCSLPQSCRRMTPALAWPSSDSVRC